MWDRAQLKMDSKAVLKTNYLSFVLVGFICQLVGGMQSVASTGWGIITSLLQCVMNMLLSAVGVGLGGAESEDMAIVMATTGITMIITIVIVIVIFAVVLVLRFLLFNPLIVGCRRFMLGSRFGKQDVGEMGYAFKTNYKNIRDTMMLNDIHIMLWGMLFLIPGIVKSYEYRMVPYLLAENPNMDKKQVLFTSKQMMNGNKMDTFLLDLSFIGWFLLSVCTCNLLTIFFVTPYLLLTEAGLYLSLTGRGPRPQYIKNEYVQPNMNQNYR